MDKLWVFDLHRMIQDKLNKLWILCIISKPPQGRHCKQWISHRLLDQKVFFKHFTYHSLSYIYCECQMKESYPTWQNKCVAESQMSVWQSIYRSVMESKVSSSWINSLHLTRQNAKKTEWLAVDYKKYNILNCINKTANVIITVHGEQNTLAANEVHQNTHTYRFLCKPTHQSASSVCTAGISANVWCKYEKKIMG